MARAVGLGGSGHRGWIRAALGVLLAVVSSVALIAVEARALSSMVALLAGDTVTLVSDGGALRGRLAYRPSASGRSSRLELKLAGDAADLDAAQARIRAATPEAGWEIRSRINADPRFAKSIERFTQFLTLVGLTALIVGGVGVGNAVHAFVERKRPSIATLKSVGAPGSQVVALYLTQVMLIAGLGTLIGLFRSVGLWADVPLDADRLPVSGTGFPPVLVAQEARQ